MIPVKLKQYHFYCFECEQKTKAMLYFKTYCPCGEAQVIATMEGIDYHGMALSPEEWEGKTKHENISGVLNFTRPIGLL